jgi:hypothetical protein
MHDLLEPVAFLVGEWEGDGVGLWAGGFAYRDTLTFIADSDGQRPVIEFRQLTHGPGGARSHGECGYLIAVGDGEYHLTVAEPSGITEVLAGSLDEASGELRLVSVEIGHSPTTDNVTAVARRWRLQGDELVTEVDIALNGETIAAHTRATLRRVGG